MKKVGSNAGLLSIVYIATLWLTERDKSVVMLWKHSRPLK